MSNVAQATSTDDNSNRSEWKIRLETIQGLIKEDPSVAIMSISNVFPQSLRDSNLLCLGAALQLLDRIKDESALHAWPVFYEIVSLLVYPCFVHAKSSIRNMSADLLLAFESRSPEVVMSVVTGTVQSTNPVQAKAAILALTALIGHKIESSPNRGKHLDFTDITFLLIQTLQAKEPEVRKASQEAIAQIMMCDSRETRDLMTVLETELPKAHFQALLCTISERTDKATEAELAVGGVAVRGAKKGPVGAKSTRADARSEHPSAALSQSGTGNDALHQEHYFPVVEQGWDAVLQNSSSRWEEKCSIIKQLYDDLANNPLQRIPPITSWQNLSRILRHVVDNESNIACCIQAIKLQGLMACNIETFPPQLAKQFTQSLIGKLKEKKPAIVVQCNRTIMSLLINKLTLTEAMTDILVALNGKSPDQKQEMLNFLRNCFTFCTNCNSVANSTSFLEDSFESISYYFKASGVDIHTPGRISEFVDAFKPRITLTTKALTAICKASLALVCDASQGIRNACTDMLSACCLFHIASVQHLQALSDALFQPMIGYQKNQPISTIIEELLKFNASSTGGSSTEMQRLKSVVLQIQAAANSGTIPSFDAALSAVTNNTLTNPATITTTPNSIISRARSPGVTPGNKHTPSQPATTELLERRSPQSQTTRTRQLATPTRQKMTTGTPAVPVLNASGVTPTSAKQLGNAPQTTELLLNSLDTISESLILADFLAKPYRLSSIFLDLTNTLLLTGSNNLLSLNIQDFADNLFVTACELFTNFDISFLQLDVTSINHFLTLVQNFTLKCTIHGFQEFIKSKGTACSSLYVLMIPTHSSGTPGGLTYRMIQAAFSYIFEFFCRYFVLLIALPFCAANPFSSGTTSLLLPSKLFESICNTLATLLTGCFSSTVPGLAKNSVDTIIPVLIRVILLIPYPGEKSPAVLKQPDYTASLRILQQTVLPLFVRVSYEPRHVFNLASSEFLLLSDPEEIQYSVNIVELANGISSICTEMCNKNVPLFPSVNQDKSILWYLNTTIDLIRTYGNDEKATAALQSLFHIFLLTLQKDTPFTVLSAQLLQTCPPQIQADILSMMPFNDSDTKLAKIMAQLSISEEDIIKLTEPVITAMKLLINHVRDHRDLLHSSLCRLIVQLILRILRVHRDNAIGVVQPCLGTSLGASLSKSAISALAVPDNEHSQGKLVYRLVRYAAIVLLECVESQGCPKFLTDHDIAIILVEVGFFCDRSLIKGLFVDETEEIITDVIELYTGMMMSLLSNGNVDTLAEANLNLILEIYVTLMSFTCDYFIARHGNDAEDMTAEITAMPTLFFRFIPENLAQNGAYLLHLQNEVLARLFIPITDSLQSQINTDTMVPSQLDPVRFLNLMAECFNKACDHVLTYLQLEHGTSPENVFFLINPDSNSVFTKMYHRAYELYGVDSKDIRLCLRFVKSMTETYVKSVSGSRIIDGIDIMPPYFEILLTTLRRQGNKHGSLRTNEQPSVFIAESASCSEDRSKDNATPNANAPGIRAIGTGHLPQTEMIHHTPTEKENSNYTNTSLLGGDSLGVATSRHKTKIPGVESAIRNSEKLSRERDRLVTAPAGLSRTTKQVSLKANLALLQTSSKEAITQIHEYALRDSGLDIKRPGTEEEGEFAAYLDKQFAPLLANAYNMGESAVLKLLVSLKKHHTAWLAERNIELVKGKQMGKTGRVRGSADVTDHPQHAYMDYLNALEAELNKTTK